MGCILFHSFIVGWMRGMFVSDHPPSKFQDVILNVGLDECMVLMPNSIIMV